MGPFFICLKTLFVMRSIVNLATLPYYNYLIIYYILKYIRDFWLALYIIYKQIQIAPLLSPMFLIQNYLCHHLLLQLLVLESLLQWAGVVDELEFAKRLVSWKKSGIPELGSRENYIFSTTVNLVRSTYRTWLFCFKFKNYL